MQVTVNPQSVIGAKKYIPFKDEPQSTPFDGWFY